jgi:predicted RNA binding protein YcfA (HicA-like mRNA interferase family)
MGFEVENKGKTSGSRVAFVHVNFNKHILIHKPHPGKIINRVYLKNIIVDLTLKQII